jgi:hypothetical protein
VGEGDVPPFDPVILRTAVDAAITLVKQQREQNAEY